MVLPLVIALIIFYLFFGGFSATKPADPPTKEEYIPWLKISRYKDKK
jgi:hypothetical protein